MFFTAHRFKDIRQSGNRHKRYYVILVCKRVGFKIVNFAKHTILNCVGCTGVGVVLANKNKKYKKDRESERSEQPTKRVNLCGKIFFPLLPYPNPTLLEDAEYYLGNLSLFVIECLSLGGAGLHLYNIYLRHLQS